LPRIHGAYEKGAVGFLAVALAVSALPPVLTLQDGLRMFRERGFDLLIAGQ